MERELNCLRCGSAMRFLKQEHIQLGQYGYLLGNLDNLVAGGLDVDILICPECGKLEFFQGGQSGLEDPEGENIAHIRCSVCGKEYEMDSPKCPFCGEKNHELF